MRGTVVSATDNEPVVGANVIQAGTTNGTISNVDGEFTLKVPATGKILVTYIGYVPQTVEVKGQTSLRIVLEEDQIGLEEVVVVGFQTQKKVNLTGAVNAVGAEVFENRPVANIGQALQGVIPNLNINIATGSPNTTPTFNIRGGTSMTKNSSGAYVVADGEPLILIDGVETTGALLNQLNPEDIAGMSVIKDASAAAIYGTKAAFGVILVTTRSGKLNQKGKVSYSYDLSWDSPSAIPEVMNSYQIQKASMERKEWITGNYTPGNWTSVTDVEVLDAMENYLNNPIPSNAYIKRGDGSRTWVASMNPFDEMVRDLTPVQKHNLSFSGGGDKITYYISLGYMKQEGMYKINTDEYNRYNAMMTTTAQVTDWFKTTARLSFNQTTYEAPYMPTAKLAGSDLTKEIWTYMANNDNARIQIPVRLAPDDPDYPNAYTDNLLSWISYGAHSLTKANSTMLTLSPELSIIRNTFTAKADLTYYPQSGATERYLPQHSYVDNSGSLISQHADSNQGKVSKSNTDNYTINAYLDFNRTFARLHTLSAIVGFNQEKTTYNLLDVSLQKLFSPDILNPDASEDIGLQRPSTDGWTRTGRAVFGRLNYNFADKYLLEFNGRYDGSSRFTPNERFLFFPSFSAGWRISEEKFMAPTRALLDNLKLRASYGTLGNQPPSNYPYQAQMTSSSAGTIINGQFVSTVGAPNLISPTLTWEKATTVNVGIDATLLSNRLDLSFDRYRRTTTDILTDGAAAYPVVLGATAPTENSGELRSDGWELAIKWHDRLLGGELRYDVGLVLSDARTKVVHYAANPEKLISKLYAGQYVGDIWGYVTGGIVQASDGEWYTDGTAQKWRFNENSGIIPFNDSEVLYPGYLWREDINGDGKLNDGVGTVEDPGDRKVLGNNTPRYLYGLTTNWSYKGLDLNLFLQGVGKRDVWIGSSSYWGGAGRGAPWMYEHAWRPDRTDADYPIYGSIPATQSRYIFSGAYLRLKQVTLGYTLPRFFSLQKNIEKLRLYIAGYNLFKITDIPNTFDPDQISIAYPAKRTIAFGLQIGF